MIRIHWDFTDGTEISYLEGLLKKDNFSTCCLDFFSMDNEAEEILVVRKDGKKISRKNIQDHSTGKQIRKEHNIRKMLVAGALNWL